MQNSYLDEQNLEEGELRVDMNRMGNHVHPQQVGNVTYHTPQLVDIELNSDFVELNFGEKFVNSDY